MEVLAKHWIDRWTKDIEEQLAAIKAGLGVLLTPEVEAQAASRPRPAARVKCTPNGICWTFSSRTWRRNLLEEDMFRAWGGGAQCCKGPDLGWRLVAGPGYRSENTALQLDATVGGGLAKRKRPIAAKPPQVQANEPKQQQDGNVPAGHSFELAKR